MKPQFVNELFTQNLDLKEVLLDLEAELYRLISLDHVGSFFAKAPCMAKRFCECLHFTIGRSTCRMKKDWNIPFVIDGKKVNGYTNDVMKGTKPRWMKDLYKNHLLSLAKAIGDDWVGHDEDVSFQVNMTQGASMKVNLHADGNDVSHQYGVGLGDYEGRTLLIYNQSKREMSELSIKGKVVMSDGRYLHQPRPVTSGTRFSIYIYNVFDRWGQSLPKVWPPEVLMDLDRQGRLGKGTPQAWDEVGS